MRHLRTLVEVWARKDEPGTADLRRALHVAQVLEDDPGGPTHLRAFAWNLVVESHRSVGWDLPADVHLSSCRAAAASLSHGSALLVSEIAAQVSGTSGPVLVLGALAAGRSIFGRWDLVPASGALLVSLETEANSLPDAADLPTTHGLRWAAPGELRPIYERYAFPASLDGGQVLVPKAELIAARSPLRPLTATDPETLVFYGAALATVSAGTWDEVLSIARALGHGTDPLKLAAALDLDRRLGLEVGRARRTGLALRRFLSRFAAR